MEFFTQHKTTLLVTLGVVVAIGVWWGFSQDDPSTSLIETQASSGVGPEDRGLVDTLLQLRAVSLSGTIFSDPAFMSLQDFGKQVIPEPVGRPNPFAPVSTRSTTTKESSQGAQLFSPKRP